MKQEEFKPEQEQELDPMAELKRAASRTSDWKARLAAVKELGKHKQPQSVEIMSRLLASDPVYAVREAAYSGLKSFGEPVQAPARSKSEPVKGVSKIIVRIRKSLPEGHTLEDFKEKLRKTRSDVYDVYEGEKGPEFDTWLEGVWKASFDRK
ncbi:HEAT repeat-containing protein [Paenibacillus sp. RU4T]|nr:HEAT repeat-containing protein [Paenibacillus sp. RU4X]SIQ36259.1 HEAT repeat-containing protein [Paenibacillus sp. RU4T]